MAHMLDWIPNKRVFLARALGACGVTALLEGVGRLRRPALVVLTYHRIAEPGVRLDPFYDPVISATPGGFAAQMDVLRRSFRPVGLDVLYDPDGLRATVSRSGKPPVLVTFDDGYRDNFDAAFPVLRERGIPAVFFIPTRFLREPDLPWWDRVAHVLKGTWAERLALRRHPDDEAPLTLSLGRDPDDRTRTEAVRQVIGLFLNQEVPDEAWFLAQLERQAEVPVDPRALGARLFMGWKELRALADAGMAIGSHGHAHAALGRLDPEAQRRDLDESRRILEEGLGRAVVAVAYPYGWPGTYTPETQRLAAEAGYALGFSSREGVNRPAASDFDAFALRRLTVGTGDCGDLLRARAALHAAVGRSFL